MGRTEKKWGGGLHVRFRPTCETPLNLWLDETGYSTMAFAKLVGMDRKRMEYLRRGQVLPTLVWAFKIERATGGKVPASAWLATEIGQAMWEDPA